MGSTRGSLERVWHVRRSSESRQAAVAFALLFAFRWGHTRRTSLIPVRSCLHFRLVFGCPLAYTENSRIRGDREPAPRITLTRNLRIRETATAPATREISVEGHRIESQIWSSQMDRLVWRLNASPRTRACIGTHAWAALHFWLCKNLKMHSRLPHLALNWTYGSHVLVAAVVLIFTLKSPERPPCIVLVSAPRVATSETLRKPLSRRRR